MPTPGNITPKTRRCLENLAVAGPSTTAELDALDPTAPEHKQTLKSAQQAGYVVCDSPQHRQDPARWSLTAKARALLAGKSGADLRLEPTPSPEQRGTKRYATKQTGNNITPPLTHGGMSTRRMTSPCHDMLAPAVRVGAEQALQIPSRVGDHLRYRDGRVAHITSSPTT